MDAILASGDRAKANLVIVPATPKVFMSEKIPYVYRPNSDFYYLTGCVCDDVTLILTSESGSDNYNAALFVPKFDPHVSISIKKISVMSRTLTASSLSLG